jgi:nucleotide-binding universal stress UspA family protein
VRLSARPTIPGPFERIVVPFDFSPWAGLGIRYARELAAEDGATVVLLHVVEEPVAPDFSYALGDTAALDQRELGARVADELDRLFRESPGPEATVEVHVVRGRASLEIPAFASRNAASLIVMPVHDAPSHERVILGSVTEKVIGRAPCPVLALRPSGRQPLRERKPAPAAARAADEIC